MSPARRNVRLARLFGTTERALERATHFVLIAVMAIATGLASWVLGEFVSSTLNLHLPEIAQKPLAIAAIAVLVWAELHRQSQKS